MLLIISTKRQQVQLLGVSGGNSQPHCSVSATAQGCPGAPGWDIHTAQCCAASCTGLGRTEDAPCVNSHAVVGVFDEE